MDSGGQSVSYWINLGSTTCKRMKIQVYLLNFETIGTTKAMSTVIIVVIIVIVLYPKWRSLLLPKDRRIIVDYVNESSLNRDALYDAVRNLQPTLDDSLGVCGLTREDLLQEAYLNAAWQTWPENANTIHYNGVGWFSDRILYQRYFYSKQVFVVHNQILDCMSGKRTDTVSRSAYNSLLPESAAITTHQYCTRRSNLYPNSKLSKGYKFKNGEVITFNWYVIPATNGNVSDSMKLLSFGETDNKAISDRLKSIKASRARRGVSASNSLSGDQRSTSTSTGYSEYNPMQELQNLVGLSSVKQEIESLRDFISMQKMRKEKGLQTSDISLHTVFRGNPGTGKTTVARIVASIFHEAGLLPTDNLIEVDRSGLVAEYIGQTAIKTNGVIDSAIGGVLFIDEAYTLAHDNDPRDFGQEAISTLLKRMEDDRGRFAVILAGYTDNMDAFMKSNPGLKSRFPRTIEFPDYTSDELIAIFKSIAGQKGYTISAGVLKTLSQRIEDDVKAKDKKCGNGRYVRNIFEKTIQNQAARLKQSGVNSETQLMLLTEDDIPAEDRRKKTKKEKGLQTTDISLHTVFTGNPGTGKTTVARIVAAIFREAGLLPTENVIEVDRSGLVGEYIGQTAIKTNEVIDKAIGGVLFIDEAYALSQGGPNDFGKEAISTLIKRMEDDRGRFAVILAGYTEDMSNFMNANPGLKSRFPRVINFPDYSVEELEQIFLSMAAGQGYELSEEGKSALMTRIEDDVKVKDKKFGNGRYIRNLFERAIQLQANRLESVPDPSGEDLTTLTEEDIISL